MDCSPPGSPVHGFSRQENCSGLPFPSPVYYLQYLIQCKCYVNSCKYNVNAMYIAVCTWQIQVSFFGTFWKMFFFKYFWSTVGWICRCRLYGYGGVCVCVYVCAWNILGPPSVIQQFNLNIQVSVTCTFPKFLIPVPWYSSSSLLSQSGS